MAMLMLVLFFGRFLLVLLLVTLLILLVLLLVILVSVMVMLSSLLIVARLLVCLLVLLVSFVFFVLFLLAVLLSRLAHRLLRSGLGGPLGHKIELPLYFVNVFSTGILSLMEKLFLALRLVCGIKVHLSVPIAEIVIKAVTIRVFMHHLVFALLDIILLTFANVVLLVIIILLIVRAILDVVLFRLQIFQVRLRCERQQRSGLGCLLLSLALLASSF